MPLLDCENCPLKKRKARFFVPPKGPPKARFAFVGEAPGMHEVARKAPFVGPSGNVLRSTLRALGTNPEDVYMTNAVKCQPSGNATPSADALACCGTLWAEFKKREVEIVVALGDTAMRALLNRTGITKLRGEVFVQNGYTVVPTYHPAYLLRRPDMFPDFADDLEYALSGKFVFEKVPPSDAFTVCTVAQAKAFFDSLVPSDRVVYDIETPNLKAVDTRLLSVAFTPAVTEAEQSFEARGLQTDYAYVLPEEVVYHPDVVAAWRRAEERGVRWVAHNGTFDSVRVGSQLGFVPRTSDDTLLLHYVLDERQGTQGLKYLAQRYLHAADWTADLKEQYKQVPKESRTTKAGRESAEEREKREIAQIDRSVMYKYNANDTLWTARLFQHFHPLVRADADASKLYDRLLIPISRVFARAALHGVLIDEQRRQELEHAELEKAKAAAQACRDLLKNPDFNPNSTPQVAAVLYDRFRTPAFRDLRPVPTEEVTRGSSVKDIGPRSTSKAILQRLARWPEYEAHEFAKLLLTYRQANKSATTYYQGFRPESDGRVHTSFNIHGTVTGRPSSSGPNLQNLTSDGPVRSIIVAPPGYVLISADYSQAEVRTMGTLAKSQRLYEVFSTGIDVHNAVGQEIYGAKYEPKTHRRMAKTAVFGTSYRMGVASIAATFGITWAEAAQVQSIIYQFLQIEEWVAEQDRSVYERGYVETPTGRKRRFPLITDENEHDILKQGVNMPIQGTASDVLLVAMILIDRWINDLGGHILFPVHDNIVAEAPREHALEIAQRMHADMVEAPRYVFGPDHIPFDAEFEWGLRYDKASMVEFDPFADEVSVTKALCRALGQEER